MTRSLILAATVLALSTAAASAQAVYMAPGYGYGAPGYGYVAPAYVAPTYVAPAYGYVAAPVYAAPVPAPSYGYAPGYATTYSVDDDWDW